jgi:MFS family permease
VASLSAGRALDRRGVTTLVRAWSAAVVVLIGAFALSTPLTWLVAVLLVLWVAQIPAGGTLAYAQSSEGHTLGTGLGTGFGLSVMAWSLGAAAGPVLIGGVASATSDAAAYGLSAGLALALVAPALLARSARSAGARERVSSAAPLTEDDAGISGADDPRVDGVIAGVDQQRSTFERRELRLGGDHDHPG